MTSNKLVESIWEVISEDAEAMNLLAQKMSERQEKKRAAGGLEPGHAVISCPDCAAKLLVGVQFLEHRV